VYMSIRTYRVGKGSLDEAMHRVDRDLAESFAQEPGFISYHLARTGERAVASTTLFARREQAEASNDLASEWVADELADFEVERMGVMGGEVMVSRALADVLEPAHS
jgi:antibiotic biosynthesis monooxygenase